MLQEAHLRPEELGQVHRKEDQPISNKKDAEWQTQLHLVPEVREQKMIRKAICKEFRRKRNGLLH